MGRWSKKLDEKTEQRIRQAYIDGVPQDDIFARFNVSREIVRKVCADLIEKKQLALKPKVLNLDGITGTIAHPNLPSSKKNLYPGHIRVIARKYHISLDRALYFHTNGYWNCSVCNTWVKEPKVEIKRCIKCRTTIQKT